MDLNRLLTALRDPAAYPHPVAEVGHVETHISHILLAGVFAYKLKKPVDLGFADFSTLARRRFCCDEELRLNRRLAPQLYLDVVPVTATGGRAHVGGDGEVLEYAVRMRRFPQRALLSRCRLDSGIIDRLADRIAAFHGGLPPTALDSPHGTQAAVLGPMLENFAVIRRVPIESGVRGAVDRLERWTRACGDALRSRLAERREKGFIRECHGDMHRGNIVLLDGEPVIFDCIEFNPALRWIDTMSELAFLVMDLSEAGELALARRTLNRYMERTGDYAGLGVLPFYQVYRAMVRAKVLSIRLAQDDIGDDERETLCAEFRRYLRLARAGRARPRPRLFITHGVSGSGKTWLGNVLREHMPVIQIRSDIERKRLFGLAAEERPGAALAAELYGSEATRRTYRRLHELAALILDSGYSVLVDATFLKREQRAPFLALAQRLRRPCTILSLHAPEPLLRQRLGERSRAGNDASDADADVLRLQLAAREPLTAEESHLALRLNTEQPMHIAALLARLAVGATDQARGGEAP